LQGIGRTLSPLTTYHRDFVPDIAHCAADPRRTEDEECDERDGSAGFLAEERHFEIDV
jgi:hypothetical protein